MRSPVSIIIIAHQNSFTLPRALKAIEDFSHPRDQKILVLNFPSKAVEKLAGELNEFWQVIYELRHQGPQHARNAGAKVASHEYLVFLDDNVEIKSGWIDQMLKGFSNPRVALGQGYVQLEKKPGFYWNYCRYKNLKFFAKIRQKVIVSCDTAAIVVKKNWFMAVKGFNPDLNYGEDAYFATKISTNGGTLFFDMKITLNQIYDPQDGFLPTLRKLKATAPFQILLNKKYHRTNVVDFSSFLENPLKGFRIPLVFRLVHLLVRFYFEVSLNPFRQELMPAGTETILFRKKKLFDEGHSSAITTT